MNKIFIPAKNVALLALILIITFNTQAGNNFHGKEATTSLLVSSSSLFTNQSFVVSSTKSHQALIDVRSNSFIVKYSSFNATVLNKTILLHWITAQEINNNYFEIERSFNGKDFTMVGLALDGFENDSRKEYAFKDNSKLLENKEVVYYRLKQYDNDKNFHYSTLLMVALQAEKKAAIQISPNPFTEKFILKFKGVENTHAEIFLSNMLGNSVLNKEVMVSKGLNNISVEGLADLPSGAYLATLVVNGKVVASQKIAK